MSDVQRCLNDPNYAFKVDDGCPNVGCYRNEDGACITATTSVTVRQMALAADVIATITDAIDDTVELPNAKNVSPDVEKFYGSRRTFFTEAGIVLGQVQTAIDRGIDWPKIVHSQRLNPKA